MRDIAILIVFLAVLAAGCAPADKPPDAPQPGTGQQVIEPAELDPEAEVYAFRCPDGFKFTAIIGPDTAILAFPDGRARLSSVPSASGAKFSGEGAVFWSRGDTAMIERGAKLRKGCIVDWKASVWEEARLMGVDFRAVGNEPGWRLDVYSKERLVLVTDYGRERYEFPAVVPVIDRSARTAVYETRNDDHKLRAIIEGKRCVDNMSGDAFPSTVTVMLDGRVLKGCGRRLR
jgi:putative lipoprotein